ncbi:hypothetical protein BDP27DRAFT_1320047 [Rhodocollybia butyracea]|uniref:ZZ-type domain-containing protein n=1 Tax=Rhodocollybia butyracea TaxID=206335 RepID=A0A9P5PZL1_9AGAR|nr:hypothetical protein BDP27DRAFT_1320047 [Rhodocollybia butyracea]
MSSTERKISQKLDSFQTKVAFLDDRDALCAVYDIENEGQDFSAPNQQKSIKNDQSKSQRYKLALQEKTVQDEQLKRLKGDLNMDVDKILEQVSNLEAKFTIELARLRREAKEMKDTVRSTGDRNWRASVKSTHFVLAIRDFYHDSLAVSHHLKRKERSKFLLRNHPASEERLEKDTEFARATILPSDEWIIPRLRVDCLRSVLDAIDVDTSGFITERPDGWSLLKWIAYWALGWKASMVIYYREIRSTLRAMFSVLQQVSPKNRRPNSSDFEDCSSYFTEYIEEEKKSLEESLKTTGYKITDDATVRVILDGPLEQSLLPLLDILLKKHLKIIKLSTSTSVPPSSIVKALQDATTSIWSIWTECTNRAGALQANFKHQRRDVQQELKIFACGLYQYALEEHNYTPDELDLLDDFYGTSTVDQDETEAIEKELRDDSVIVTEDRVVSEDSNVAGDAAGNSILTDASTPLLHEKDLPPSQTLPSETLSTAEPLPLDNPQLAQEILREWTGYIEEDNAGSATYMHHYTFRASPLGGSNFDADGTIFDGGSFSISGTFSMDSESDKIHVKFIKEYDPDLRWNYIGTFDRQTGELSGFLTKLDLEADVSDDVPKPRRFCFRPISPFVCQSAVCLHPTDLFSETATDFEIARQQLRDAHARNYEPVGDLGDLLDEDLTRNRVKSAFMMGDIYWRRQNSMSTAGSVLTKKVLPDAMRNYYIEWDKEKDTIEEEAPHHRAYCDNCGEERGNIIGNLVICVTCSRTDRGHVDLCSTVQCIDSLTHRTERGELAQPHELSHGLLRLPSILHLGMESDALFRARRGLNEAKAIWEEGMAKKRSKVKALDRESPTDKKLGCRICWRKIVSPFWFCIDCSSGEDPVLLCNRCGVDEIHHDTHLLVRYSRQEQTNKGMNIEQQLTLLHKKTDDALQRVQAVQGSRKELEQELKSLREDVQSRLDRIESILTRMIPMEENL